MNEPCGCRYVFIQEPGRKPIRWLICLPDCLIHGATALVFTRREDIEAQALAVFEDMGAF